MNDLMKPFLGAWSLREYKLTELESGKQSYPFGEQASGHIIYTSEGVMSATLLDPDRAPHKRSRATRLGFKKRLGERGLSNLSESEKEIALVYLEGAYGFFGYSGTFSADETKVYHHIENSFFSNYSGTTIHRSYSFVENKLYLTASGGGFLDELIWTRVEK